ncbi:MAG TPA: hypothetical protein VIK27_06435, partial [Candidatus Aquilonibacter sp.]
HKRFHGTIASRVGKRHLLFTLHSHNYSRSANILDGAKLKDNNQMAQSWRSLDKLGMTTTTTAPISENP